VFAIVLAVALASVVGAGAAKGPRLAGTVGPGFTITLNQGAKKVTSLKAGRYTLAVNDRATTHNFHLRGPGINRATSVAGTGRQTWTVTIRKGTYRFVCDPHASGMKGSFRVR
jgi:plastocyanin